MSGTPSTTLPTVLPDAGDEQCRQGSDRQNQESTAIEGADRTTAARHQSTNSTSSDVVEAAREPPSSPPDYAKQTDQTTPYARQFDTRQAVQPTGDARDGRRVRPLRCEARHHAPGPEPRARNDAVDSQASSSRSPATPRWIGRGSASVAPGVPVRHPVPAGTVAERVGRLASPRRIIALQLRSGPPVLRRARGPGTPQFHHSCSQVGLRPCRQPLLWIWSRRRGSPMDAPYPRLDQGSVSDPTADAGRPGLRTPAGPVPPDGADAADDDRPRRSYR